MKLKYIVKNRGELDCDKVFTFGAEYEVLADYRKRRSEQQVQDNGFVVKDDTGSENMLFPHEVKIIEDNEDYYIFS